MVRFLTLPAPRIALSGRCIALCSRSRLEVLAIRAGEKTNVTPDQATARIRLLILPDVEFKKVEEKLSVLLERQVDLKVIPPGSGEK